MVDKKDTEKDAVKHSQSLHSDRHAQIASKVFKCPLEEVTPEMRRQAKAINFGSDYAETESIPCRITFHPKAFDDHIREQLISYMGRSSKSRSAPVPLVPSPSLVENEIPEPLTVKPSDLPEATLAVDAFLDALTHNDIRVISSYGFELVESNLPNSAKFLATESRRIYVLKCNIQIEEVPK